MAARWTTEQIKAKIKEVADAEKVPYELALGVALQESGLDPDVIGDNGKSLGIYQLQPGAAIDTGINPLMRHVPALNITGGVKYLKQKLAQAGGDEDTALKLYNGGGDPNYVQNVRGMMAKERGDKEPTKRATSTPQGFTYTQQDVQKFLSEVNQGEPPQSERGLPGNYEAGEVDPDKGLIINIEKGPRLGYDRPEVLPVGLTRLTPEMDDDEILERLGYDPAMVKKSSQYRPGMFKEGVTDPNSLEATLLNSPVGGVAQGVGDLAYGGVQLGARGLAKVGLVGNETLALYDALRNLSEANYQQNIRKGSKVDPETGEAGMFSDPSRLVGAMLPTLPFGGGAPTTLARTVGRGALMGGATAALQPVNTSRQPGSAGDNFWAQKAGQTATGAVLGGTLGPALERGVVPALTRGYRALRRQPGTGPEQRLLDIAERHRIRTSYGDVAAPGLAQKVEARLPAMPLTGAARFRQGQQADVMQEAPRVVDRALEIMRRTGWRNLGQVQAAARRGGPRAEEARVLLDEIAHAGDDWGRVIQASGKLSLFQDRLRATQLYDQVERLAQPLGNVPPTRTVQAIDDALADVNQQIVLKPEVRREVQQSLQRVRDELTPSAARPQVDTRYGRLRQLDSHLSGVRRDAVEPTTAGYLGQVRSALRADMDAFAQHSGVPQLTQTHREANRFYRERVVRYREGQLAKAIKNDLPDEIYNKFVRQGADRARYFYEGLDPKGQAAVRYGMMQEAFEEATKVDPGIFHPGRFAHYMDKLQKARGVFFRGRDAQQLGDFTDLMRHIKVAGDIAERGPQSPGIFQSPFVGAGAAVGLYNNPAGLPVLLGTGYGLRLLLMTPLGRNFLLASGRLQPGDPRWLREAQRFASYATRGGALASAQPARGAMPEEPTEEGP